MLVASILMQPWLLYVLVGALRYVVGLVSIMPVSPSYTPSTPCPWCTLRSELRDSCVDRGSLAKRDISFETCQHTFAKERSCLKRLFLMVWISGRRDSKHCLLEKT
jgi:hypothetical protein